MKIEKTSLCFKMVIIWRTVNVGKNTASNGKQKNETGDKQK